MARHRCGGVMRLGCGEWVLAIFLFGISFGCSPVWGNGNVSADEAPPPVKKSVQKAPVKKAAPVAKKATKAKKKTAPSNPSAIGKKAAPSPRVSSLQQGIRLMRQERYEAAYPWLQKAVQEERRNPEAWYWYGMYHERTAQFEQAQFFYRKAMELDPGFEPFSRVVAYPGDGERVPLWDPKRPARVYPIPTNDHGMTIIPPDAPQARRRPVRPPIDPELPKVPVYTPPEPGAGPFDGDAWQPSIYVPPGRERLLEGGDPVYTPPESRVVPLVPPPPIGVGVVPGTVLPPEQGMAAPQPAPSGPAPVYQPPLPGAKASGPEGRTAETLTIPPASAPRTEGPAGAAVSGDAPLSRPPMPGLGGISVGTASGDQPVYWPPMPAGTKK